jgi:uridine phosphorylase
MPEGHQHPEHHIDLVPGDVAPTVLVPADPGHVLLFAEMVDHPLRIADKREYLSYSGSKDGIPISCTSAGFGCPPTSIAVEELWHIGAKNLIRIGTCMPVQSHVRSGDLVLATGAVRGERTSEEYIPLEYPAVADLHVVRALIDACSKLGFRYHLGIVRTHDAYYLESPQATADPRDRLQKWIDLGILAIDYETSALLVVSSLSGVRAGAVLAASNPIGEPQTDDSTENIGVRQAMEAAIEAARLLAARGLV